MADPDLERILREHSALAHRMAASHEANPEAARDLAQDILVAVWRAWPAFRRQCSERTYVARIAHHRIVSHIAGAARRPAHVELTEELPALGATPEEQAIRLDERARLLNLVRTLPLALREVAVLLLEGFTTGEVAETLGITGNAAAIRGNRAREQLRVLLEKP